MSDVLRRREIPVAIAFVIGLLLLVEYFVAVPEMTAVARTIQSWGVVFAAMALGVGALTLGAYYYGHIRRRTPGTWYLCLWSLLVMVLTITIGVLGTTRHPMYIWLYSNIYFPLSATTVSLLGYFVVSAAFRAFRARNVESALLLLTAIIVMLANIPYGRVIWSGFEAVSAWVLNVVNLGAFRGIQLGIAVGGIMVGIRRLVGR